MEVAGNWTLFYNWEREDYHIAKMEIKTDGTFNCSWQGGEAGGRYTYLAGMFSFQFNDSKVTYSGNLVGKSVTGISSAFDGYPGYFYMLQEGVPTSFTAVQKEGKKNVLGK